MLGSWLGRGEKDQWTKMAAVDTYMKLEEKATGREIIWLYIRVLYTQTHTTSVYIVRGHPAHAVQITWNREDCISTWHRMLLSSNIMKYWSMLYIYVQVNLIVLQELIMIIGIVIIICSINNNLLEECLILIQGRVCVCTRLHSSVIYLSYHWMTYKSTVHRPQHPDQRALLISWTSGSHLSH